MTTLKECFGKDSAYWGTRENWIVVITRTRDSDLLETSNWHYCLKKFNMVDNLDKIDVAIERAGHWACGWLEYLVISPDNAEFIALSQDIDKRLKDYPVLDDDDYSNRQWEEADTALTEALQDFRNKHNRSFPVRLREDAMDYALDHDGYISISNLEDILKEFPAERVRNTIILNGKRYACRIWDNGGKTLDRYTIAFKGYRDRRMVYPYLFSGIDPHGMSGHGESDTFLKGKHLGKRIAFEALPEAVQNLIKREFA